MFKKIFVLLLILLLFTSCGSSNSNNTEGKDIISQNSKEGSNTNEHSKNDPGSTNDDKDNQPKSDVKYTGEIITNGNFIENTYISFVPDKETKKLIQEKHKIDTTEESLYVKLTSNDTVIDIPEELGIYKVEIEFAETIAEYYLEAISIKKTDNIGTVEYQGKAYDTNVLDENVKVKDTVCGMIVSMVSHYDDDGIEIDFAGTIDVEGYYELYNGGEMYNDMNLGMLHATDEGLKNVPVYKNGTIKNNICTIYFRETNELYKTISDFSKVGKGTFRIDNYLLIYNVGRGFGPSEAITEIVSLDEKYENAFPSDKVNSFITHKTDKYLLVQSVQKKSEENNDPDYFENSDNIDYYIIDKETDSLIKIFSSNGFKYEYSVASDDRYSEDETFVLKSDGYNHVTNKQSPSHTVTFQVLGMGQSTVARQSDYADFKDEANDIGITTVFTGDKFKNMTAESISAYYLCKPLNPEYPKESDYLVKLYCEFVCENLKLDGTLHVDTDPNFGFYSFFSCDEESAILLPHGILDEREGGSFRLLEENVRELLGSEADNKIERKCTITISRFSIGYRYGTECYDFGTITNIQFKE